MQMAHALKSAYLGRQTEITSFLLEQCPSEVLFQFLSMTTRPGYRPYHTIFRWINRESMLQHMAMTHRDDFLDIIYRRLSGRWMSKLHLAERRFKEELQDEADLVRRRAGEGCLASWAGSGRSTNPKYILRQVREPSTSSANLTVVCARQDSFENDFVIRAKEIRPNKPRHTARSFVRTKNGFRAATATSCTAGLPSSLRPRKSKKLGRVQVAIDRRRKYWGCE